MVQVLATSWALLLGIGLLMIGNGMQGTLLGLRGGIEGFSTAEMSVIMSAYFVGFLGSSRVTPILIRRVGHVRVFAALGSFISAALILYPTVAQPWAWALLRVAIGFCFCGVYIVAESWLNNTATNETRGQTLSAYMIVQMGGIVAAQGLLVFGDPSGFVLFVIPSVLVSLSFAPILLSVNPTPAFESSQAMSLRRLFRTSPTGCVGMFLMGLVFSAQFGMASVYGSQAGMTAAEVAAFVAAIYTGGLLLQFPIGWLSDRLDRRMLIVGASLIGGGAALAAAVLSGAFVGLLVAAFLVGGMANPLYALFIAYTNDYLDHADMASASGGLLFINGLGAIAGPLITGAMMGALGPNGFWLFLAAVMLTMAAYALYRMTQRAAPSADETATYIGIVPTASPVAVEVAQEWAIDHAEEQDAAGSTH
ncbi:MFS transporter [Rhodobacteraceae bacterium CCMM004]|nr:MFS transporter [Rhodobacteraceae bacterium CCMM004]